MEAFPGGEEPALPPRDNDGIYGEDFSRMMRTLAIGEARTPYRSPWCNPFGERVIGMLRRECTYQAIALGARHLECIFREYVERYYNPSRPHMSLARISPTPRTRERTPAHDVVAEPVLGGLHHCYHPAA